MTNDVQIEPASVQADDGFITETELIARLKISRGSAVNYRQKGTLPFVRLGNHIRYHWPTVSATLLRQQREATA